MYVYFYLFTRAGLSGQDGAAIEAAQSLGASRSQILFRVTLPRLRPALAGATLLTFMTSLGSFSAPYIFGGGDDDPDRRLEAERGTADGLRRNDDAGAPGLRLAVAAAPDRSGPGPGVGRAGHAAGAQAAANSACPDRGGGGWLGPRGRVAATPRDADPDVARATEHVDRRGVPAGARPRELRRSAVFG
ncbi:MAG: ABC transporter permease subunit [Acidobacteria bacterium]|nr:ABC transporter permease subunit [Acidobacteriota bacterium]